MRCATSVPIPANETDLHPEKTGTKRPLGLPSWSDKLVGEEIRLLLEAYYEPRFSDRSHGFRPRRGCHTALREVAEAWRGRPGSSKETSPTVSEPLTMRSLFQYC